MDGLILLLILIPVILLIIILNRSGNQGRLLESLHDKIKKLTAEVSVLSKELKEKNAGLTPKVPVEKETTVKIPVSEKPVSKEVSPPKPIQEKIIIAESAEKKSASPGTAERAEKTNNNVSKSSSPTEQPSASSDIEKFIGENVANKIGIAVLVSGIGFFVKYAIDNDWVNETGRVIIGLICGGILIGLAHYFRNTYRSFSSVLVGGGLTVFYFSIAFAFHQYHLVGQTAAFIIMVLISFFAVVLSLYYNRQELAILAAIGGFITPFLVNTGQDNYVALFSYLCILNAGLTALSWFKKWPAINTISLFFTTIIFSGWLIKRIVFEEAASFPFKDALLFATLFFGLFVTMNIINSVRLKNKFTAFDFIILLCTNFLYYTAGINIMRFWNTGISGISLPVRQGVFTLLLGLFNLLLAGIFSRKKTVDKNFVSLLTGLALSFISLTAPLLFRGHYIVLCWAAEAIVLLVLYKRSKIVLLKTASLIVVALTIISLVASWNHSYFGDAATIMPVIINKGFITVLVVAVTLFLYQRLLQKEEQQQYPGNIHSKSVSTALLTAAIGILYLAGILELYYQFNSRYPFIPLYKIYLQAYTFIFVFALLFLFKRKPNYRLLKLVFTFFCTLLYLPGINISLDVSYSLISGEADKGFFTIHWIASILLLGLLTDLIRFFFWKENTTWEDYRPSFTAIAAIAIVLVLSIELYYVNIWLHYRESDDWYWWKNLYQKAGLSICWSICSFIAMWVGMRYHFRTLRIISLSLFTVTLVKLFTYDIRNIPPGGKIAAFILLGILLLAVSFMYQRLKKIIIDEAPAEKK